MKSQLGDESSAAASTSLHRRRGAVPSDDDVRGIHCVPVEGIAAAETEFWIIDGRQPAVGLRASDHPASSQGYGAAFSHCLGVSDVEGLLRILGIENRVVLELVVGEAVLLGHRMPFIPEIAEVSISDLVQVGQGGAALCCVGISKLELRLHLGLEGLALIFGHWRRDICKWNLHRGLCNLSVLKIWN